ncbi:IQ domain-containing protein IQM2-like [Hordeum vulgare subsp. vulgare]|uniref:IQ domain-containing protein IQM2-like n=1 Tax=Hordeum vulgare subsp. vulgare TaxID=112509 RepID=UPI001D1A5908|nr:IQ domain-containing protein IQM2-like [Hordeum vulgare subsp. vulgare]
MEAAAAMHQKSKGTFQHSSFLAGGATSAAGRLVVANGILKAVWPHSRHYRPTEANFREFMKYLRKRNVDLTDVKLSPTEGEEDEWLRSSLSQMDLSAVVLLPLLIYGFKLGITRAAISTVASHTMRLLAISIPTDIVAFSLLVI